MRMAMRAGWWWWPRISLPPVSCGRLRRRVRRQGQKTTETVYLISSLTLAQMDAAGFLNYSPNPRFLGVHQVEKVWHSGGAIGCE